MPSSATEVYRLSPTPFEPGSPSGSRVKGGPWVGQPVQGFSGLTLEADGGLLALTDNGYGALDNSADFQPAVYRLEFHRGVIEASLAFHWRDGDGGLLTGADIDPEALVRAPDGTYWVGEEFGPSLLHFDARGRMLAPPFRVPGFDGGVLRSVDAPELTTLVRTMLHLRERTGTSIASPAEGLLVSAAQVDQLHRAGFRVVPWTVNDVARMRSLVAMGVDGLISDRPDLALALDAGVEVQGHRGARGLRPESTLPAFEVALELGVDTLEFDLSRVADGGAVVWHDARLASPLCRGPEDGGLTLREASLEQVKAWTCDGLKLERFPAQRKDVGPATMRFVAAGKVPHAFAPVTLRELLDFVESWLAFHPAARPPKLNIETKGHGPGDVLQLRDHILNTLRNTPWEGRATLQSFDFGSLGPGPLPTVALIDGVAPKLEADVVRSAGFENLALSTDGLSLYAMLEKPNDGSRALKAWRFDLKRQQFDGLAFQFPLAPRAVAVGDITMVSETSGLALERDDTEGDPRGYKRLVAFELPESPGGLVQRSEVADLQHLTLSDGGAFGFPFWTIEGVAKLHDGRVAIIADNNFPFGRARRPDSGVPDETEVVLLRVGRNGREPE